MALTAEEEAKVVQTLLILVGRLTGPAKSEWTLDIATMFTEIINQNKYVSVAYKLLISVKSDDLLLMRRVNRLLYTLIQYRGLQTSELIMNREEFGFRDLDECAKHLCGSCGNDLVRAVHASKHLFLSGASSKFERDAYVNLQTEISSLKKAALEESALSALKEVTSDPKTGIVLMQKGSMGLRNRYRS